VWLLRIGRRVSSLLVGSSQVTKVEQVVSAATEGRGEMASLLPEISTLVSALTIALALVLAWYLAWWQQRHKGH